MGQKVNPHGLRVGVIKDWDSRWYARNEKVGDLLVEDKKIRDYLKKTLYSAGIPKIEIERDNAKVRVYLHCARPGVVIGKGGEEINKIQAGLTAMVGKPVDLKIIEVRNADMDAQLVAENIAQQLEKRIGFRRAMKNAMGRAMRAGARGIKTCLPDVRGDNALMGSQHQHLVFQIVFLAGLYIPSLIQIAPVHSRKVSGVIDNDRPLTFEKLVHIKVCLHIRCV